jgi:hypothetical protein
MNSLGEMRIATNFRTRASFVSLVLFCSAFCLASSAQEPLSPGEKKPVAIKVLEIGKVTDKAMRSALEDFSRRWEATVPLYIINYGTDKEVARRERLIANIRWPQPYERARITLVRGGLGKGSNTVIWKVPFGADNPVP